MEGLRYYMPLYTDLLPNTIEKADLFLDRMPEKPKNSHGMRKQVLMHILEAQWVNKHSGSHPNFL